jgi:hypothetical protein
MPSPQCVEHSLDLVGLRIGHAVAYCAQALYPLNRAGQNRAQPLDFIGGFNYQVLLIWIH